MTVGEYDCVAVVADYSEYDYLNLVREAQLGGYAECDAGDHVEEDRALLRCMTVIPCTGR